MASAAGSLALRAQQRPGAGAQPPQPRRCAVSAPFRAGAAGRRPAASPAAAALAEEAVRGAEDLGDLDVTDLYDEFTALLDLHDHNFKRGDMVTGTVFRVDDRGAYVDIGAKGAGYCPSAECSLCSDAKASEVLATDSQREFVITRDDGKDGQISLSLRQLEFGVAWSRVRQMQEEDVTVQGKIMGVNRGGLLVDVEHLRGFVPTSLVVGGTSGEKMLGQTIPLKFIEVDEERQRLVFSNRKAQADSLSQDFKVGDVVVGTVESIKPYGAFVDVGGTNGLLHVSQISHDIVTNVENVLSVGDKLKVMILSRDRERGRVSLSTRKLEPTPGDMLRDPALVYAKADEMAATFRERVAAAEAAAREEEERLTAGSAEAQ